MAGTRQKIYDHVEIASGLAKSARDAAEAASSGNLDRAEILSKAAIVRSEAANANINVARFLIEHAEYVDGKS